MTMMITAEYMVAFITCSPSRTSVVPMLAKISPTSPRGIMPKAGGERNADENPGAAKPCRRVEDLRREEGPQIVSLYNDI